MMRKRVLLFPAYCYPEHDASSHLSKDRQLALISSGFDILVFAATPSRNITREDRKKYKKIKKEILLDGHKIIRRYSLMPEHTKALQRAFRYCVQVIKQFNRAIFCKEARECDVMWISSTPPMKGALLGFSKFFTKIPLVYNLQDVFPDSLVGTGLAKRGGLLWKVGMAIAQYTYKQSDAIIVISKDSYNKLIERGVPEEKLFLIYNWIDSSIVAPVEDRDNPLFEEYSISRDKFRVVYAGNLGYAQNVDIIVDAALALRENEDIQFVIFGNGGKEKDLKNRIARENLDNIRFIPLQPYDRVSYVYSLGSVCVVSCKSNLGGSAMPSKTWTIMSCGRPVLASFDKGELEDIITTNQCGLFTPSDNTDAFVSAILTLYGNSQLCKELGQNARKFIINNLSKEVGVSKFVRVINSVLK